jgi:triosephosphate isomerase
MIFVNFKNYANGRGEQGEKMQRICHQIAAATGVPIYPLIAGRWSEGILLNHSSKPMTFSQIKNFIRQFPSFKTLVCCSTIEEGLKLAQLKPGYLAYEPAELIGGRISVATARPEIIKELVERINFLPILVGAGIHRRADVVKARQLGAVGILVSAAIMTAPDPQKVLLDLAQGFQ